MGRDAELHHKAVPLQAAVDQMAHLAKKLNSLKYSLQETSVFSSVRMSSYVQISNKNLF